MPDNDQVVEILIIVNQIEMLGPATEIAHSIEQAIISQAQDMVDLSGVLGDKQALLIRFTRRDFDAAVDLFTPMLVRLGRLKDQDVRVVMEAKTPEELRTKSITRLLV